MCKILKFLKRKDKNKNEELQKHENFYERKLIGKVIKMLEEKLDHFSVKWYSGNKINSNIQSKD